MSTLSIDELSARDAFPHPVERLQVRETHISWVVLTGPFAYKIKKPVKLDFIDASTLERRRHYCEEELRLNRRLAPELYVDVVPISRIDGRVRAGSDESVIECAVRMKQFDSGDEMPSLLDRGAISLDEVTALGELLGQFHLDAPASSQVGFRERTQRMYDAVLSNLEQLTSHSAIPGIARLSQWTQETADALEPSMSERERSGYVRECHGDLHCANIVRVGRRLVPFDCIDFDADLRWIDVMSDIGFLVMDLTSRERSDLACALLTRYLEVTGDYAGVRLLSFYAVYRALVRARVDAISAEKLPDRAAELQDRLHRRVLTAIQWMDRRCPTLILMHGVSGSGKSWLSERLVAALPALRVRSDVERKRLASSNARFGEAGLYSPAVSHRTYAHLCECAESCLQAGFHTIVDAAFLDAADRELLRGLATRLGVRSIIVSCQADPATLSARVQERQRQGSDPSDADQTVLAAQLRKLQPLTAEEQRDAIVVDTRDKEAVFRVASAIAH